MEIDFSKPVQTKDGTPVRILCTDGPYEKLPIIGILGKEACVRQWQPSGQYFSAPTPLDLINVPPKKHVGWINIYGDPALYSLHETRIAADYRQSKTYHRTACIQIEYFEGEGLMKPQGLSSNGCSMP